MQYSTVDGQKTLPFPKGKGACDVCGAETLAKCGEKKLWHWAHKSKKDCDPWWENETEWHRGWKEKFPEKFREIVHRCEVTGEKHRADIKSDKGIILEIQNSPISLEELRSRESFYKNLIWIVNAEKFKSRFTVFSGALLPNPQSKKFDDIVFIPTKNHSSCTMFYRKSKGHHPATGEGSRMVELHSTREIQKEMNQHYIGHHSFYWQRPHVAWLEAKCPVFLDFGTDILWRIEKYRDQFLCVRVVKKEKVISDIIGEAYIQNVANGDSLWM